MTKDLNTSLLILVVLTLCCAYIFAPIPNKPGEEWIEKTFKLNLGIDLQGGAEVVYRVYDADHGKRIADKAVTQRILEKIRKRIDRRGLKEPWLNVRGNDQIQIQLPGIDAAEWSLYKSIVERLGHLELLEVADQDIQKKYLDKGLPQDDTTYRICQHAREQERLVLIRAPIATGEDVTGAGTRHDAKVGERGAIVHAWLVTFRLGGDGAKRFHEATKRLWEINRKLPDRSPEKRRIAIVLDGKIESAPSIEGAIYQEGQITGSFTEQEAKDLAVVLETGGLSYPIGRLDVTQEPNVFKAGAPEFESLVGPSLGQDAIWRGILAVVIGFILVAVFMIVYYRLSGFVAVVTLGLNLLFLMTLLGLMGATITLPGIAGIVLTVGMAVDANILVLERVREELAKNKTTTQAFEHGYERALSAIVDGNLTTIIVAIVLFFMGVGSVKGFAITLALGILTTLFTALTCGKLITRLLLAKGGLKTFSMMHILSNPQFKFVKYMRTAITVSGAMIAASILFAVFYLDKALGFDFKGGCVVAMRTSSEMGIEEVRKIVGDIRGPAGSPVYSDAAIQIMSTTAEKKTLAEVAVLGVSKAKLFKITTGAENLDALKKDLAAAFAEKIQPPPFEAIDVAALSTPKRSIMDRNAGAGFAVSVKKAGFSLDRVRDAFRAAAPSEVASNPQGFKYVGVHEGDTRGEFVRIEVVVSKEDFEAHGR
ncbi:MAG TPA: protein translocase subunit SecD, partial [Planctomycetota bacterium]|nr:protein translocase subunit SecD [Planctomycetota bacterium]